MWELIISFFEDGAGESSHWVKAEIVGVFDTEDACVTAANVDIRGATLPGNINLVGARVGYRTKDGWGYTVHECRLSNFLIS